MNIHFLVAFPAPLALEELRAPEGTITNNKFLMAFLLFQVAKKQVDRINIEQAFKTTLEKKAPICLFLYYKLTKEIVQDITDNFTKVKNQQNPATELRYYSFYIIFTFFF